MRRGEKKKPIAGQPVQKEIAFSWDVRCECGLHYHQNKIVHDHDVTVVLVETAEAFVDSLICNFNIYKLFRISIF